MRPRRGATALCGILLVDKPTGMTSHDVIDGVRRATGERRVGHAGTLDPMATGLLVVLVGPATRLAPFLASADKTYIARVAFGAETDTDDADGLITTTALVPDEIADPFFAAGTVASLVGDHDQIPPQYSAIKRAGHVAHEVARRGGRLDLEPRRIAVTSARLLGIEIDPPAWDIELTVSKGTYVRALARDLGRALDTAAHLASLRRTRSGQLDTDGARTLSEVADAADVRELFCSPIAALALPVAELTDQGVRIAGNGGVLRSNEFSLHLQTPAESFAVPLAVSAAALDVAVTRDGVLLGVYGRKGDALEPRVIIPGGVAGGGQ